MQAPTVHVRELVADDFYRGFLECLTSFRPTVLTGEDGLAVMETRKSLGIITLVAVRLAAMNCKGPPIIGTLSMFFEKKFIHMGGWVCHVEDVVVSPSAQGQDVGTKLMEYAVGVAKRIGCYKMVLDCSPDVQPFYEKLGLKPSGAQMRFDL